MLVGAGGEFKFQLIKIVIEVGNELFKGLNKLLKGSTGSRVEFGHLEEGLTELGLLELFDDALRVLLGKRSLLNNVTGAHGTEDHEAKDYSSSHFG